MRMFPRTFGVALSLSVACTSRPESSEQEPGPVVETGIASFYSDALAGRPTASGEPYNPSKETCAHPTMPLGTVVEVERLKTGLRATCRINDRGPYHEERIIDLSRAVAESLEIDGIAKVSLRVVQPASDRSR